MENVTPVADEDDSEPAAEIEELLKFDPAPRKRKTVNGWTPALQRRFIALLAATGSPAKAAEALRRRRFGAEKLYKAEGADSFRAAWDRAIEIAEEREAARREEECAQWSGVRPPGGIDRRKPGPPPRDAPANPGPQPAAASENEADSQQWLDRILTNYWHKVVAERQARLNGEIVVADFYLRQLTSIEIALDVASGGRGLEQLRRLRLDGRHLIEIAETPFSRLVDHMRRHIWRLMGEPERPEHPPRHLLVEQSCSVLGAYSTEPTEFTTSDSELGREEQKAMFKQEHEKAAEAQLLWEARAVAESAAWRERLSTSPSSHPGLDPGSSSSPPGDTE